MDAGKYLAGQLKGYAGDPDAVVFGLPRGGIVVAFEVAQHLNLPLDVFLVRKIGVPGYEELAMGAIASGGIRAMNEDVVRGLRISAAEIEAAAQKEYEELQRREKLYRGNKPPVNVKNRTVILIDDGLATGATMRAAVAALKKQDPKKIIVAVPVAAPDTCDEFRAEVEEIVCGLQPDNFQAVGFWYKNFSQTSDAEVSHLLRSAGSRYEGRGNG